MEDLAWCLWQPSRKHPEKHRFCSFSSWNSHYRLNCIWSAKIVKCGQIDEKEQLVIITTRKILNHEPIRHLSHLSHFVTGDERYYIQVYKFYCYWCVLTFLILESWLQVVWKIVQEKTVESITKYKQMCAKLTNSYMKVVSWNISRRIHAVQ